MSGLDLALWGTAAALTAAATWLTLPRPPALDWELYLGLLLATRQRGDVEADGGDADAWVARCREHVWYHPGGRDLDAKVEDPAAYEPAVPAREGERALLEALQKLDDPAARLAWLLEEGCLDDVLFADPSGLGSDYDLEGALGPDAGWEGVAGWTDALLENLRRRNAHNTWVVLGEGALAEGLADALKTILGDAHAAHLRPEAPDALAEALDALLTTSSARMVLLVRGAAVAPLLACLHSNPGLRDRMRLIVGLGVQLAPLTEWLAEHFDHQQMDTEIARALPYMHLGFVVPGVLPVGEPDAPLAGSRFPSVPAPPTGRVAIEAVDLGFLPGSADAYPPVLLAQALAVLLTTRLAVAG